VRGRVDRESAASDIRSAAKRKFLRILPIFLKGRFPMYVVIMSAVYAAYIVKNLIVFPFPYLFSRTRTNE